MTTLMAWLPVLIGVFVFLLYLLSLKFFFKTIRGFAAFGMGFGLMITTIFVVSLIWRASFMDVLPTFSQKIEDLHPPTAIIFSFGFERSQTGQMLPGPANEALYRQAKADAAYEILILQEGVMVAACEDTLRTKIDMHPLNIGYVNTLVAAKYAIHKMDSLHVKKAVVYAHNQQLARAVYCLKRVAASNPQWQDMEFITPTIPSTPYPRESAQWHTQYEFIYLPIELFISRPMNTIYPLCWIKIKR